MAAELDYQNNVAQMFSVRQTPWHREGFVLPDHVPYEQAIELVGFNYPLEKRPYAIPSPAQGGDTPAVYRESKEAFFIYRADKDAILGSVGRNYEIVTNLEAFEILRPLCDEGVLKLETGGVLRKGADAWLMGSWDLGKFGREAQEVFNKDGGILPYATVMANHNGRRGVLIGETSVRLQCSNTLAMAERESEGRNRNRWRSINHIGNAKAKLAEAANELFFSVVERFEIIAKQYKLLMETPLSTEDFSRLVLDSVCPDPRRSKKFNPEAKLAETVLQRAMEKRTEITRLWTQGTGHTGERNSWFAYNAATEALDHNLELWPTRAGSYRTASLLTGQLGEAKNRVLDKLVSHALSA